MKNINDNLDLTILELQMLKDMTKGESFYTYNDVKVDTQRNVVEGKLITVLGKNSIREEKNYSVEFDLDHNMIRLCERTNRITDVKPLNYIDEGDAYTYRRTNIQQIREYQIVNGKMKATGVTVSQSVQEDTLGGGEWIILPFSNVADALNAKRITFLPTSHKIDVMEEETWELPEGYKITDGLAPFTKIEEKKEATVSDTTAQFTFDQVCKTILDENSNNLEKKYSKSK